MKIIVLESRRERAFLRNGSLTVDALTICRAVLKINDAELDDLECVAKGQLAYFSPLKMATQARQHALGTHNLLVLHKLKELRMALRLGAKIGKRSRHAPD